MAQSEGFAMVFSATLTKHKKDMGTDWKLEVGTFSKVNRQNPPKPVKI